MVLNKAIFILGLLFTGIAACQRVPDWERRSRVNDQGSQAAAFEDLHHFMWTCQGILARSEPDKSSRAMGILVDHFFDFFRKSGLSVVDESNSKTLLGTAFLWNAQGYLLTLNQWVEEAGQFECRNRDHEWLPAKIAGRDPVLNLALLKIDPQNLKSSMIGKTWRGTAFDADSPELFLVSSSYPGALDRQVVLPQLRRSHLNTGIDDDLILFSPTPDPVHDGSILVNAKAELVGYAFGVPQSPWGAAIDLEALKSLVDELIQSRRVSRPDFGFRVRGIPDLGFSVQQIDVTGPGYRAGLRLGDVLVQWDDRKLKKSADWPALSFKDIGKEATLTVMRGKESIQIRFPISRREIQSDRTVE